MAEKLFDAPLCRIDDLSPNARTLIRGTILAFPVVKEFRAASRFSEDETVAAVEELMFKGLVKIVTGEKGMRLVLHPVAIEMFGARTVN